MLKGLGMQIVLSSVLLTGGWVLERRKIDRANYWIRG